MVFWPYVFTLGQNIYHYDNYDNYQSLLFNQLYAAIYGVHIKTG